MKFIAYHKRFGYLGMTGEDIEYKGDDKEAAALFSKESAMKLMVDVTDPRISIENLTNEDIFKLPYQLIDTDDIMKQKELDYQLENKTLLQLTSNTMSIMSGKIDTLNLQDEVSLDMSDLTDPLVVNIPTPNL